jgi:hypothetical protein
MELDPEAVSLNDANFLAARRIESPSVAGSK